MLALLFVEEVQRRQTIELLLVILQEALVVRKVSGLALDRARCQLRVPSVNKLLCACFKLNLILHTLLIKKLKALVSEN